MMSGLTPTALLQTATDAARAAGRILAERFNGERTIEFKGGIDLVTDADKAAEAAVLGILRERHPDHAVLAEESGVTRGSSHRWIVDPLDGTTNYAHRVPHFCVSIGVEDDQGLAAGVVYDPIRDELFAAARGQGATLNGAPIRVSGTDQLGRALVCTGFPYDVRENPLAPLGLFNRIVRHAQGIRRTGSAALDLAYVACGRFDGFFEFGLKAWDIAAGVLLITEAGGNVSRIDGAPVDLAVGDLLTAGHRDLYAHLRTETGRFLEEIKWEPRRTT